MQISGAQIIVQSLHAENVEYVFGYPGGAVLEIYDAIYQLKKFKHILTRHEQAAVHAADAYLVPAAKWALPWLHQGQVPLTPSQASPRLTAILFRWW